MELLKGTTVAKQMTAELTERVKTFKRPPCLAIVRAGDDPGAIFYVVGAKKRMDRIGIECREYVYPADIPNADFQTEIKKINADDTVDGVIVMAPLPPQIDTVETNLNMDPSKDMDADTDRNRVLLYEGKDCLTPCTPEAVVRLLKWYGIPLEGKRVVIVGRSVRVGRPLLHLMLSENATVTVCHSKTADLRAVTREADILVIAIGKAEKIDDSYVREGTVVVDVGTNSREDGSMCGDVNFAKVSAIASALSPVPGGVGTITNAILAEHVVNAYEKKEMK